MCTWEGHLSPQPKGVTFQAFLCLCVRSRVRVGVAGKKRQDGLVGEYGQGLGGTKLELPQKTGNTSLSRSPVKAVF